MFINTYNLTGQALRDAWAHNMRQEASDQLTRIRNAPWRIALRRLAAYLAIRLDPAWLDASADVLEGHLPERWQTMPHHELIHHLTVQGITPEHCIID